MASYWVYICGNVSKTVIYIGMTNDIGRRMLEHKAGLAGAFTKKYNCTTLFFFKEFDNPDDAILAEKYLKGKTRAFKESLIFEQNPDLVDLSLDWGLEFKMQRVDLKKIMHTPWREADPNFDEPHEKIETIGRVRDGRTLGLVPKKR